MAAEDDATSSVIVSECDLKARMNYSTLSLISVLSSSAPPLSNKVSEFDAKGIVYVLMNMCMTCQQHFESFHK